MSISESQLETWSHQGSVTQSAATYETIRRVLASPNAPYASRSYDIFLQGSYGNNTNIYAESDVDIVIALTSTYYSDLDWLNDNDKQAFNNNRSPAQYGIDEFRAEVLQWLKTNYGSSVEDGNKAIRVNAGGGRRDADVLPCAEHRLYRSYNGPYANNYEAGITFWPKGGSQVVNFPKQHKQNCIAKHSATNSRFKPAVRVFKNMRNAMQQKGYLTKGRAPSYFIEGMLSNVPPVKFTYSRQSTFENAWNWLKQADRDKLMCANGIHFLCRKANVCWDPDDFEATLSAYATFWNDGG